MPVKVRPRRAILTEGLFHALKRTKNDFSLLFQTLPDHEKLQKWSLWHGYSDKTIGRLKDCVELC